MSKINIIPLPPVELLEEMLDYDPASGILRWKERPSHHFETEKSRKIMNTRHAGKVAGYVCGHGYILVGITTQEKIKRRVYGHRLAWTIFHKHDPIGFQIDHINSVTTDNRIANLRLATRQENQRNQSARTGSSNFRGVSFRPNYGTWRAYIFVDGAQKNLGSFKSELGAAAAYDKAAITAYGSFAKLNFSENGVS